MIINISRGKGFRECRVKQHNWDEKRLISHKEAEALLTGGAFHAGVAEYFSHGDASKAVALTETHYRKSLEGQLILPEEQQLIEYQIELSRRMVQKYADHYRLEDFQVLHPEVSFMIALPGTEHHCWFAHRLLHPQPGEAANEYVGYDFCTDDRCRIPHYLKGRTDAVVNWRRMLWLLEHKTSAISGDIFYAKYELDDQCTAYQYGIEKTLGLKLHGFILNLIKKPKKNAVDQFAIEFEREPFLRTEADLAEFEQDIIGIADDYERAWRLGGRHIYKNPENCIKWNRKCFYHELCKRNQKTEPGEFRRRADDYVNLAYYELLRLPVPSERKEEDVNSQTVLDPDRGE